MAPPGQSPAASEGLMKSPSCPCCPPPRLGHASSAHVCVRRKGCLRAAMQKEKTEAKFTMLSASVRDTDVPHSGAAVPGCAELWAVGPGVSWWGRSEGRTHADVSAEGHGSKDGSRASKEQGWEV